MTLIPIHYYRRGQGHATILVPEADYRPEVTRLSDDPEIVLRDPNRRAA